MSRANMAGLLEELQQHVKDVEFVSQQYRESRLRFVGIENGSIPVADAAMYLQLESGNPIQIGMPDRDTLLQLLAAGSTQMMQSIMTHWVEINQISAQAVATLKAATDLAEQAVPA